MNEWRIYYILMDALPVPDLLNSSLKQEIE